MVRVLEFGVGKYAPNNWRLGGPRVSKEELADSLLRHSGELVDAINEKKKEIDPESVQHLIGHIMCNAMFYAYHHVVNPKAKKK